MNLLCNLCIDTVTVLVHRVTHGYDVSTTSPDALPLSGDSTGPHETPDCRVAHGMVSV